MPTKRDHRYYVYLLTNSSRTLYVGVTNNRFVPPFHSPTLSFHSPTLSFHSPMLSFRTQ